MAPGAPTRQGPIVRTARRRSALYPVRSRWIPQPGHGSQPLGRRRRHPGNPHRRVDRRSAIGRAVTARTSRPHQLHPVFHGQPPLRTGLSAGRSPATTVRQCSDVPVAHIHPRPAGLPSTASHKGPHSWFRTSNFGISRTRQPVPRPPGRRPALVSLSPSVRRFAPPATAPEQQLIQRGRNRITPSG